MRSVPIVTFHAIDDSGSVVATAERRFATQMEALAASDWHGVSVGQVLAWAQGSRRLQPRSFGIAFDDGYRSVYERALPVLRRCGFAATVFAITGRCGGDNRWQGQPATIPGASLMSWDELGELAGAGWEVGAHGVDHRALTELDGADLTAELERCHAAIEQRLGVAQRLFAYPYGASSPAVREAVAGFFDGACGVRMGHVVPGGDPYDLRRIDAYYLRRRSWPATLGSTTGRAYLALRRIGRRLDPRRRRDPS